MHRAYAPRLRSPGSPASRDRRRRAGTKPSRIRHPQRSRTKAPIVCNPNCVCKCECVCGRRKKSVQAQREQMDRYFRQAFGKWDTTYYDYDYDNDYDCTSTWTGCGGLVALVGWFSGLLDLFLISCFHFLFSFLAFYGLSQVGFVGSVCLGPKVSLV